METDFEKFQERLRNNDIAGASDHLIASAVKAKAKKKAPKPVKPKTLDNPAPKSGSPYGYFEYRGKKYENKGDGWKIIMPDGSRKNPY